ncbi:alpha/beta fold hydrolase [Parvularcula maris]|uniref:Alpha/beta fold hydrolase n=1 Tax=Parvularcula maris TaxID=2965077 RepID=A0A9X2LA70_9PROT|nr:alpha/beta fold hydrolase [Parvularcula maris]MCQ8185993.1 alpha/beta fold hydrolase [Parvularcula maris]
MSFADELYDPMVEPGAVSQVPASAAAGMRDADWEVDPLWTAQSGDRLEGERVRLRFKGNPRGRRILVLGGISAGRRVTSCDDGWWGELVGPQRAVCCDRDLIIGADYLPEHGGQAKRLRPEDFANLFLKALRDEGVEELGAVIGASFGGMVALAMARLAPARIGRLAVVCAAHRPHPMATAVRHIQRQILELTEGTNREAEGVGLARQLAMTTYRSAEEFGSRFGPGGEDLEAYLKHHGDRYASTVSAARYRTLSAAIDAHSEDPSLIKVPTTVIAAEGDQLVPLELAQELAARLPKLDRYEVIPTRYGHDAFLKETAAIAPILKGMLS